MTPSTENSSPETATMQALSQLESLYLDLKSQVGVLKRRAFLTPREQMLSKELKKKKLAIKDAIATLRPPAMP